MKKKPSLIFSILMNILNNLQINDEYSINEISEKSGLHWQTTNEYLRILTHLLKFSPKIKINENNKIEIASQSEFFEQLSISQKILVTLYESKAFNEKSSMRVKKIFTDPDIEIYLEDLTSKAQIKKNSSKEEYFITNQGKIVVISLYSDLTQNIFNFDYSFEGKAQTESFREYNERINAQNSMIISQNKEIMEQNKIIMFLLGSLVYKGENRYNKATDLNLEELSSNQFLSNSINTLQRRSLLRNTIQTDQEVDIKIKRTDKITSDYEYTEVDEFYKEIQDLLKGKFEKKNLEVTK